MSAEGTTSPIALVAPPVRAFRLVLPSVVCANFVAEAIAADLGPAVVAVPHQHGCGHIGDDAGHTAAALASVACNPNVVAVVVVSLGCETLQGRKLASEIARRGQLVEFVGIQDAGGTARAIEAGKRVLTELSLATQRRREADRLVVGVDADNAQHPDVERFVRHCAQRDTTVVVATTPADQSLRRIEFGEQVRPGPPAAIADAGRGLQRQFALAAAGAEIIVSFVAPDRAPVGFPLCPVIAVPSGSDLHADLQDDFDVVLAADPEETTSRVWTCLVAVAAGELTESETVGAVEFALPRLALTL